LVSKERVDWEQEVPRKKRGSRSWVLWWCRRLGGLLLDLLEGPVEELEAVEERIFLEELLPPKKRPLQGAQGPEKLLLFLKEFQGGVVSFQRG